MRKLNILGLLCGIPMCLCACTQSPQDVEIVESVNNLDSEESDLVEKVDNLENNADIEGKNWVESFLEIKDNPYIMQDLKLEAMWHIVSELDNGIEMLVDNNNITCNSASDIDNVLLKEVYFGSKNGNYENVVTMIFTFDGNFSTGESGEPILYENCAVAVEIPNVYYNGETVDFGDVYATDAYTSLEILKDSGISSILSNSEVYEFNEPMV